MVKLPNEIDVLLLLLKKRWKIILSFILVSLLGGVIFYYNVKPKYKTSLTLFAWNQEIAGAITKIKNSSDTGKTQVILRYNNIIQSSLRVGSMLIKDYKKIINSQNIKSKVLKQLKEKYPGENHNYTVKMSNARQSCTVDIICTAYSGEIAAAAANFTAQALIEKLDDMMRVNYAHIVYLAKVPKAPFFPKLLLVMGAALLAGIGLGGGVAWLVDYFDKTLKDISDLNHFNLMCLGVVPFHKGVEKISPADTSKKSDRKSRKDWHALESFRIIQAAIKFVNPDNPPKLLCVTSDMPGVGKTTIAGNIANVINDSDANVIVVDCDLRKPRMHNLFMVENNTGLVNYLIDQDNKPLSDYIHSVNNKFDVLTCGIIPPNPTNLLQSKKFKKLLEIMKEKYDYVIIDCPPIANLADTIIISSLVDGLIMVANPEVTRTDYFGHALNQLGEFRNKIIGAVLNKTVMDKMNGYYGQTYYTHE